MSSGKNICIKRINKDIKEITKNPIEGIGIVSLDNDLMKYIVNICIMNGIYKGYCVQLRLTFPDNYPTKPPKILIYPDQAIDGQYHHHIFPDNSIDEKGHHFKKFCFDLLDNDFMSISTEHSGWNPSYSITSLLLQVQNFLGDPDMHESHLPNKEKIAQLMKSMDTYERTFIINDENGETKKVHTWKNPYPEMYFKKEKEKDKKNDNKNEINEKKNEEEQRMILIKENLTCFMLKTNYIDDPDILLGYPISQKKGLGKDKYDLYPIPELLTYDGFMAQIGREDSKLDFYFNTNFKSANNEYYNYWVPIYIDANHYSKNRTAILNSFSIIKFGPRGIKEYDFKPEQIFEILPIILNKMIIGMFNGQSLISSAFIRCYFHYVLLFKKLSIEFEDEYVKYLNDKLNLIKNNKYDVAKSIIPDIGNFLVLLFFCNKDTHGEKMTKMWYSLFEEFLIRQMYWMFYDKYEIKNIFNRIKIKKQKLEAAFEKAFGEKIEEMKKNLEKETLENGRCFIKVDDKKTLDDFIQKEKVIDKIVDHYKNLLGVYDLKYCPEKANQKRKEITNNFPEFFNSSTVSDKKYYYSFFFKGKENYGAHFVLSDRGKEICEEKISSQKEQMKKSFEKSFEKDFSYDKKIKIFFKNYYKRSFETIFDEFLNNAYKSQKGNSLLVITFFAQKKIEEKGFMEKLEKNYGIYLEVDNFIKEMKQKLEEIKSYKQLFEYIGSEFGKDQSDIKLIKNAYFKAQKKGYIHVNSSNDSDDDDEEEFYIVNNRGRGRGRGEERGFYRGRLERGGMNERGFIRARGRGNENNFDINNID
jgi:ubiquitin-conjugating enzyme E2 A